MKRLKARNVIAAIALSTTALVGAIGTASSAGAASTSSPAYTVMVIGTFTGLQSYSLPELPTAVQAAFKGTKVKVITCDDQGSTSAGQNCMHQAVADHVAAVDAGFAEVAGDESILTQAGIPVIGTTDATSPNSFAVSNGTGQYAGIGVGLYKSGCRRLGILYLDGTDFLAQSIISGGKWQSVTKASIPINAPDLTPSIAKLAEAKVQCVAISTEPNTVIQAMTAIKQNNLNVKVAMVSAILTPQVLSSLGSQANGIIAIDGTVDPADKAPVVVTIKKQMHAVNSKEPVTTGAIIAWASAKLLQDAAQNIHGPVTAASMMTALSALRNASTDGAIPPFTATPLTNPAFARFFNHYDIDYVIKNGHLVRLTNFYDVTSALDNKSA